MPYANADCDRGYILAMEVAVALLNEKDHR